MPASSQAPQPPTVFISYAHENETLRASVKALADWLGHRGCSILTDHRYVHRPPPEGWQAWMLTCIDKADTVLVVCTPKLKGRYEKSAAPDSGRGATYEGAIVTQHIYDDAMRNTKFFPILPDDGSEDDVPTTLKPWWNGHRFPSGNDGILRMVHQAHPPRETDRTLRDPLSDRNTAPQLVHIPAGAYLMGSPNDERGRRLDEYQHEVRVGEFYIGKYPVTFRDYDLFCEATNSKKPFDQGWGREGRPVIKVTLEDALSYLKWLCLETGKNYRLPTEAEWEYAARAGTETRYWWGEDINQNGGLWANCRDCGSDRYGKTSPTGAFPSNPWGLHDMAGNIWEMTSSLYVAEYSGAELRAADPDVPGKRVMRGGSWLNGLLELRSARRQRYERSERKDTIGFRVAREA